MKILLINKFLYPKGGDAISTITTGRLLKDRGHEVFYWGMEHPANPEYPYREYFVPYIDYNKPAGMFQKLTHSLNILYSFEAKKRIDALLKIIKPDIVHLNNFAHQLSPSILDAIKKYNIPAVMTMHDYKMVCPAYSMLLHGKPCERCSHGKYYNCFTNKCTKGSALKSLVNTIEMYLHHRILHIYDKIDLYISPSRFQMEKVKEMGFKRDVVYLPNFADIEDFKPVYEWKEDSIVYVGRLSYEKGVETSIDAVKGLNIMLKIIGEGPEEESLKLKVKSHKLNNVHFMGYKTGEELKDEIRRSMFMVIPSEWYENNPRSVIEAFALGKPVIGARIGGIPELVNEGETGYTFEPCNTEDLKAKIGLMIENKDKILEMGRKAREFVERELNPERHYKRLMEIYEMAMRK